MLLSPLPRGSGPALVLRLAPPCAVWDSPQPACGGGSCTNQLAKNALKSSVSRILLLSEVRLLTQAVVPFTNVARGHPPLLSYRLKKSKRLWSSQ